MNQDKIKQAVAEHGYTVINVDNLYFYTVGMASQGKNDLIGFCHYPISFFHAVASKWAKNEVVPNKGFYVHELKFPALGMEPSRCRLLNLDIETSQLIQTTLAKKSKDFEAQGFFFVAGPDKNNFVVTEEDSLFKYKPSDFVRSFISGVDKDIKSYANEAERIRRELGIK